MTEPGTNDKKAAKAAKKAAELQAWKDASLAKKVWTYTAMAVVFIGVFWFLQSRSNTDTSQSTPPAAAVTLPSSVPQLSAGQQINLLDGLRAIDPGIVGSENAAISNARNICSDLRDGVTPPRVSQRYDRVALSSSQETQIVGLIRTTFCPW